MTEKQLQWFTVLQSAEWKVNGRKKEEWMKCCKQGEMIGL